MGLKPYISCRQQLPLQEKHCALGVLAVCCHPYNPYCTTSKTTMEVRPSTMSLRATTRSRTASLSHAIPAGQRCSLWKGPLTRARIFGDLQSCILQQNRGSSNRCVIQPASNSNHVGASSFTASSSLRNSSAASFSAAHMPHLPAPASSSSAATPRNVAAASAATMSSEAAPSDEVPSRSWNAMVGAMTNTTHDSEIFKLALPALVAMLLDPVMGALSASMIGHLGTQQLSAISVGILTTSFCTFLFSFLVFLVSPGV